MTNPECTRDYSCIDCWGILTSGSRVTEHLPSIAKYFFTDLNIRVNKKLICRG